MSDYMEVLYNPKEHTHESCLKEISSCDLVVLIIGSRFGGRGVPAALNAVDMEKLREKSFNFEAIKENCDLSITQLEVCKAIEQSLPVFAFVTEQVWHDHNVYEANKDSDIINKMRFPSIEKTDTARYIFEFINFLRQRTSNNSVIAFSRVDEIEDFMKRQWSSLFQRLLDEQRQREGDQRRLDVVSSEIADLRAAIMSSISAPDLRQIAKGAIRFRHLIQFLSGFASSNLPDILKKKISWDDVLAELGVTKIVKLRSDDRTIFDTALVLQDGTYFKMRFGDRTLRDMNVDWEAWKELSDEAKMAIMDAVIESSKHMMSSIRYVSAQFEGTDGLQATLPVDGRGLEVGTS